MIFTMCEAINAENFITCLITFTKQIYRIKLIIKFAQYHNVILLTRGATNLLNLISRF